MLWSRNTCIARSERYKNGKSNSNPFTLYSGTRIEQDERKSDEGSMKLKAKKKMVKR